MDGTIQYGHVGGGADYDQVQDKLRRLVRLREEYGVGEPLNYFYHDECESSPALPGFLLWGKGGNTFCAHPTLIRLIR